MAAVPAKGLLESAIAVSDWLLSCLAKRRPARYSDIFERFYSTFSNGLNDAAYILFTHVLVDVFEILAEAEAKGGITAHTDCSTDKVDIHKSNAEIVKEAEDFLMFLLVFAKTLDSDLSKETKKVEDKYVAQVVMILSNDEECLGQKTEVEVQEEGSEQAGVVVKKSKLADIRLKVMMAGFNALSDESLLRFAAWMRICEFASEHKLFDVLLPYIYRVESWMEGGQLSSAQWRKLYTNIASHLRLKGRSHHKDLFYFDKKILKEFGSSLSEQNSAEALDVAAEVLKLAMALPDVLTLDDLMENRIVQRLKSTKHQEVFELATIFTGGGHKDFDDYVAQHPGVCEKYELDATECREKIKLLELASLATSKATSALSGQRLGLEVISRELETSSAEAEDLAVKAISVGVIDGQIDQMNAEILIRSALHRSFGRAEWEMLGNRLHSLHGNIGTIIELLEKTKREAREHRASGSVPVAAIV